MKIGDREIGEGHRPWIVAEIGASHNGSLERALKLVAVAKECGADAVKFQSYTPDSLTIDCDKDDFIIRDEPWAGRKLYDLYCEAATPREWFPELFRFARGLGLVPFASVFAPEDVDFIEQFKPDVYKISSFENIDAPLIDYTASKGSPLIISAGMASEGGLWGARIHAPESLFLHCVSAYPCDLESANLGKIKALHEWFGEAGLSDHTLGSDAAIIAVGLGVCIIEKHLTWNRDEGGLDAAFSSEPHEFADMVSRVHKAWQAVHGGSGTAENACMPLRRSLYAVQDIKAGERFTRENVRSIRPGFGLHPARIVDILGYRSTMSIERGTALKEEMIG